MLMSIRVTNWGISLISRAHACTGKGKLQPPSSRNPRPSRLDKQWIECPTAAQRPLEAAYHLVKGRKNINILIARQIFGNPYPNIRESEIQISKKRRVGYLQMQISKITEIMQSLA
jgi:hypothetical protein